MKLRRVRNITNGKKAFFHCFSTMWESGAGQYPIAIIEYDNGEIDYEYIKDIIFLNE